MVGSGAPRPRPGLAHGWTQGPAAEDASVLARTDVRSGGHRAGYPIHMLVVGDDSRSIAAPVTRDLAHAFPCLCLDRIDGIEDLAGYEASLNVGDHVLMGLVTSEVDDIDGLIDRARSFPALQRMQWVVVTDKSEHRDLARCMQSCALASVLKSPWTVPLLAGQAYSTMVRYLRGCGYSDRQIRSLIADPPPFAVQGPLLEGLDRDEREVVMELLAGVERVLGQRPRLIVPEGTQLVTQGEPVGAVYLVLDGQVSLHRDSPQGEVLAHLASSGPLIGLVSLARAEDAFFTGETATEATLVRLTTEQLQIVISEDPSIGATLTALAIRSLTRRLMRAEDLHLENAMLAEDLEAQKEALAATLEDLRATRAELVERARFAMLGELSAGIAHELNNPVTALVRAAKHLHEDVDAVLAAPATYASMPPGICASARAPSAPWIPARTRRRASVRSPTTGRSSFMRARSTDVERGGAVSARDMASRDEAVAGDARIESTSSCRCLAARTRAVTGLLSSWAMPALSSPSIAYRARSTSSARVARRSSRVAARASFWASRSSASIAFCK